MLLMKYLSALKMRKLLANKSEETNQKPASGFLIAHFKR